MKYIKLLSAIALPCLMAAAQTPSPAQAEALVKEAVVFAKQNGLDKLIAETNRGGGKYHVNSGSELYIFIYDQQGVVKAIGFNPGALVGKDRIDAKDPDGKMFIREIINVAKAKGKGWVNYKYTNPTNNKVEQKTSYVEMLGGVIVGAGIYKN
jgi:signal transduction histidine kinase